MKKLKNCSISELDTITKKSMSDTIGGSFIKNQTPNPDNQVGVDVNCDPVKVTGVSVGRRF